MANRHSKQGNNPKSTPVSAHNGKQSTSPCATTNWRDVENEKEKYAAYLCSREWSVLKEAVHKRAGGLCERCKVFPITAVHHLTYARKYAEQLEDLAGHCEHCHAFTHGKAEFDPAVYRIPLKYLMKCGEEGRMPAPFEAIECLSSMDDEFRCAITAINQLRLLGDGFGRYSSIYLGIQAADGELPFNYADFPFTWYYKNSPELFGWLCGLFKFSFHADRAWMKDNDGDEE